MLAGIEPRVQVDLAQQDQYPFGVGLAIAKAPRPVRS